MSIAVQIIVGIIAILGTLFFLTTGIAMNRAADAVTRANMGSPAIYVGFPLVACALLIADSALNGFSWAHFIEFLLITFLMPVGSSMGSMALGRSMMLAQVRMDPRTMREDLREGSQDVAGQDKNHQHTGTRSMLGIRTIMSWSRQSWRRLYRRWRSTIRMPLSMTFRKSIKNTKTRIWTN